MSLWRLFPSALRATSLAAFLALSNVVATANCFSPGEELSGQEIQTFLSDPGELLRTKASGRLTSRVRDLAASDAGTLNALVELLHGASDPQQRSVGLGLALAANQCQMNDANYAAEIQQKVAESNEQAAIASFDRSPTWKRRR